MQLQGIELRYLIERLKAGYPNIYRGVFGRIYSEDPRFHDWRLPLWLIGNTLSRVDKVTIGADKLTTSTGFAYQQIALAGEYNFPLFFVEPELFKACASSGLPKGLKISELKMPFPAFTFVLPKGALVTKEGDVPFITVSADLRGRKEIDLGYRKMMVDTSDDGLIFSTFFPGNAGDFSIRVTDSLYNDETLPVFHEHMVNETGDRVDENPLFGDDTEAIDDITMKISALIPALIMAMECRPDIVTHERFVKQIRRDRHTEVWQPNRLGEHFRLKLEGGGEPGSHSSPRAHVRRGHFRLQPIGHGKLCVCKHAWNTHDGFCMIPGCDCKAYKLAYTETKKIWIEPMLVNFKTDKEIVNAKSSYSHSA